MAKFFGEESAYLLKSQRLFASYAFVIGMTSLLMCVVLYFWVFADAPWRNWLIIFFVLFYILVYPIYKRYDITSSQYDKGRRGEAMVRSTLTSLSDEYSVFQDVQIGLRWNIDFVVVGPTGVFTLEVKSHGGIIGYNGLELTRYGKSFEKNILNQSQSEALSLHTHLKDSLDKNIFVMPVIVFTGWTKISFGMKLVKNNYVIQKSWLNRLLEKQQSFNLPVSREEIEKSLLLLTKNGISDT